MDRERLKARCEGIEKTQSSCNLTGLVVLLDPKTQVRPDRFTGARHGA